MVLEPLLLLLLRAVDPDLATPDLSYCTISRATLSMCISIEPLDSIMANEKVSDSVRRKLDVLELLEQIQHRFQARVELGDLGMIG